MLSTPVKRSAPHSEDSWPNKRQATSSPEEGELDDNTPPPPIRRSPTPVKPAKPIAKIPFPFKQRKPAAQETRVESTQLGRGPYASHGRAPEEERLPDMRWGLPSRPAAVDPPSEPASRNGDHWSRHEDGPSSPRHNRDREQSDRHYDYDRQPTSRKGDHWDSRDDTYRSPRRYHRRTPSRSRSRSSGRSRSPYSPGPSAREKHRLPPPRSPLANTYTRNLHDERDRDYGYRLDSVPDRRRAWESDTYVPEDDMRGHDSRHGWKRGDGYSRRSDDERDQHTRPNGVDSYRPMSPRSTVSSRRPLSPRSPISRLRSPDRPRSPPPQPELAPPPSPPRYPPTINLPSHHATVKIPLPKKPPTPPRRASPVPSVNANNHSKPAVPERDRPSRPAQVRARKPVHRTKMDEMMAYGKTFEGCGSREDYDIITKLGEGTFGEVHKARNRETGSMVALKRILMHNEKEGMPVTALREIKILKALHHPCIVDIVDMFVVRSRGKESPLSVYMVFPYMDHDLAGLLENERVKLSPSQIKLYMKQLLEGTEYMHRNHILHRDMKAANLLISNTGSLKIADFGLARAYDPNIVNTGKGDDLRVKERKYTNCVVTRWYRPPELLLGARQYGGEVDMWGIGCVLGEMFWRKPILPGSSDLDQLDKIWQLCGTPNQHTWPNHDLLPGCEGVKRFTIYPRRLKQTYDTIGAETCDLLDKLLTCNPRERLTASQALDHDYFWTDPLPADPKTLPTYEASHEFDKRGRRHQPAGPPVQPHHVEQLSRPLPAPTQPPMAPRARPPPMPPKTVTLAYMNLPPPPPGAINPATAPPPPGYNIVPHVVPQQLPPLTYRPGMTLPPHLAQPVSMPLPPKPDYLPSRPGAGRRDRNRGGGGGSGPGGRSGGGSSGPAEGLNYG
ncbi:serine/threonine protein kinase, CMGC, CDC2/CDK sub [Steccherinum ochraceum]|uniref:Serine/threonine protein kinase, CMGC, CDC2/CDK sub n=1 Tax=Steccherinum ochraceum TaxID=92696 RepID=A0A4R0RP12_9APHY|nr:serine/threonine protein kinase, CMGC, CDC2/CDK sub [Steccherinum ochraceum]